MVWFRLDDDWPFHPKVIRAGKDARQFHCICGCYCGKYLTDGFIADSVLPMLGAVAEVDPENCAERLVEVGMWERRDGGYQLHDFLEYNPSRAEVMAKRAARASAGRKGGLAKARANARASAKAKAESGATSIASPARVPPTRPDPSRPVPTPEENTASAKRPRSPSRKNAIRKALEEHFIAKTKLPRPPMNTARQKKGAGERWWQPLRRIGDLCHQDLPMATGLIDAALERLQGLTVSAPQSILKTAEAIMAEWARGGAPPTGPSIEDEWLAEQDDGE